MEKEIKKSQELISKITSGDIKQNPSWYFIFRNYIFWSIFFVFIIFGGIAFSIVLYAITASDFDLLSFSGSRVQSLFSILPLLWILFLVIFSIISIFGMRYTKTGYRYTFLKILSFNILLSIFLGALFFYSGGAKKMEQIFAKRIPIYKSLEERKTSRWSSPENGFLSGIIIEKKENIMIIEDWNGKKWKINFENAVFRGKVLYEKDDKIKMVGEILSADVFNAIQIGPWERFDKSRNATHYK